MKPSLQIIFLALIFISLILFLLDYIKFKSWIVAIGVVVGMKEYKNEDGIEEFRPMIMYTHNKYGEQVIKTGVWTKYTWLKGDLVEIIYDQSKMNIAKVNKISLKYSNSLNIGLGGIFGLIFISLCG